MPLLSCGLAAFFCSAHRLAAKAVMPILLWYLPFTMFYGTCDLLFAELEMQVTEDRPADLDQAGPEDEATQH
jgi:hypothetical protein